MKKDDSATDPRSNFAPLVLRECSQKHPMIMFSVVVSVAFVWALMPGETTVSPAFAISAPAKAIQEPSTTGKNSRLPIPHLNHACEGQSWGGESAECLKMIARDSGRTTAGSGSSPTWRRQTPTLPTFFDSPIQPSFGRS